MSEIKWAYDEKTGTFSALPASVFLLPAILLAACLPFIEKSFNRYDYRPRPVPDNFDKALYDRYAARYKQLKAKQRQTELTLNERLELHNLTKPPWSKPGEYWHYD